MKTLVIPDLHGDVDILHLALSTVGAIDPGGQRTPDWYIVQLGDALNCVRDSIAADEQMVLELPKYVDKYLIGNHEYPYITNVAPFGGFYNYPPLGTALREMYRSGYLMAAHAVNDILITHAGAVKDIHWDNAESAAEQINTEWQSNPKADFFTAIGPLRSGMYKHGGILWAHDTEPKNKFFSQIYGHTVGSAVRWSERKNGTFTICLDLGAKQSTNSKLACAIIEGDKITVEEVTLSSQGGKQNV